METINKKYNIEDEDSIRDWNDIENSVITFQKQFSKDATKADIANAKVASDYLINKFSPLITKYVVLLKTSNIDFDDTETKQFVSLFIDEYELKKALNRKKIKSEYRAEIYKKFNFITGTYGMIDKKDMTNDLNMCFLQLCKRYKQVGKNFCAYVYNSYRYEVARHIKKFIQNPLAIEWKILAYEDCINGEDDYKLNFYHEDNYHEDNMGLPDYTWVNGQGCSDIFSSLSSVQRKILIKYYLEDWNDKQIAEHTGLHINTINQKRRVATETIANKTGMPADSILRSRKSGKKASLPI